MVDAHSPNNIKVAYNGTNPDKNGELDQRSTPNYWLDMDGNWFELKKGCDCGESLNLKQGGDTDALTTTKEPIYVTQNNKKVFAFKAVVGEFSKKSNALNAADFKDHAIAKITLQSTDQQENKQYKDALNKAEGKTSPFYIAMDAEPVHQNWFEVKYEEVFDSHYWKLLF
ncbi:hypothetical protein [Tenacibaculum maritimum]|uniref:hypothetical protein n=1 Tax=Tenacibaculum maritimum TaxID=107401 RepID=UPI00132F53E8|nr:hypothetical protein [Tenacibaculum maritimum]